MVKGRVVTTLGHTVLEPAQGRPTSYMLFAHGILGTRANWRGMARRIIAARPGWGAVLVDLREHGESLGHGPPHTLRSAADDIVELEAALGIRCGGALGHSFGGKVVMEWTQRAVTPPSEVWVVDSRLGTDPPKQDDSMVLLVLKTLSSLPRVFADRHAFVESVIAHGHSKGIAQWLAMNLRREADGTRVFGPDLRVIEALLRSYISVDMWRMLEADSATDFHIVVAGESTVFSRDDRDRLDSIAETRSNVHAHLISNADHWVHVDAPDALVECTKLGAGARVV